MKNDLFRKEALQGRATPERMDEYIQVSSVSTFMILGALFLFMLGVLMWGFFGHVSETVTIQGVIFPFEGTRSVVLPEDGVTRELYVKRGDYVHTGDRLQIRAKEQDAIVSRFPSEIFPEYILIRVNEFDKVAVTPLDEWMRYLKDGVIASDTTAPGLGEAREQLRYYSLSDTERRAYDEHINDIMIQNDVLNTAKLEGRAEGLEQGRAEGIEQGRMEERLSTARNLKKLGIAPDTIAQATGLSLEKIEKL